MTRVNSVLAVLLVASIGSSAVEQFAPPAATGAAEPFLFASPHGLLLSWMEPVPNSDRMALRFARFADGNWSDPQTIAERSDFFVNWADFPSVVQDEKGVLFAHWLQKSGGTVYAYDVHMATSPDGGKSWSESFLLNRDGVKNEHGFVTLSPLPGGGVAAAWLDGRKMPEGKEEGEMTLRYATVGARGDVQSGVQLDGRTCECCTTGMTITPKGVVIVYRDRSPDEIRDIAYVRRTANGWTKPRLVQRDGWKISGCPVNGPQIDSLGNRVAVAWFAAPGERGRVSVAFSNDGGATFGRTVAVDEGKPLGRVDVLMLDGHAAVVSWLEQTAAGAEIRARRVEWSGRTSPSVKIADSSSARAAGFPRIARLGSDVYFAWTEQSATTRRIHVARHRF